MKENETQNLAYAGFLFKKTLQPHSLRNEHFKQATDFKDKNLVLYVNQKFKEIRKRMGTDNLPKSVFLQSILQTKSSKTDINKILVKEKIAEKQEKQKVMNQDLDKNKKMMMLKRYEPTMNSINKQIMLNLNDKKSRECFVFESVGAPPKKLSKKPETSMNPDKKVRAILHDKLTENELKDGLSQFNKLRLKSKFQQLKDDKNFEKIDFNKKFKVINQIIHTEDDPTETLYFMTEICHKNDIDLAHLLNIDKEKIKLVQEMPSLAKESELSEVSMASRDEKKKKKTVVLQGRRRLSAGEIEEIIQREEDNQTKNLIDIFKKTQEEQDEYKQRLTSKDVKTKVNFQDQLFEKMDNHHRNEVLRICTIFYDKFVKTFFS